MDKQYKQKLLNKISYNCQSYRMEHGYTQADVAKDLGCSIENVSAFENSRNDNFLNFLWYICKGMTVPEILNGIENEFPYRRK